MSASDLDRVFGRSRLRMVTGAHVEVFREEALAGERRRYTKRFLATPDGDFRLWTEREWRILARLMGHGVTHVPDVVQFDRGAPGRPALVQTYDAGVTVDHWATLLPLARDGALHAHVFEDCAHWWALARHALLALDEIHALDVVHLDLKADNVCIPYAPPDADPIADPRAAFAPRYEQLTLIDFAFSLVSGEPLVQALPIARQPDYAYQSPRLLHALDAGARGDLGPTQRLDWRCDLYSLAAMLRRYLPDPEHPSHGAWNHARHAQARALVRDLVAAHDAEPTAVRPHARWIGEIGRMLEEPAFADSLARGWSLAWTPDLLRDASPTPITRIALPVPRERRSPVQPEVPAPAAVTPWPEPPPLAVEPDARVVPHHAPRRRPWAFALGGAALAAAVAAPIAYDAWRSSAPKASDRARVAQAAPAMPAAEPRSHASAPPKTEPAVAASKDDTPRSSPSTSIAMSETRPIEKTPPPKVAIEPAPKPPVEAAMPATKPPVSTHAEAAPAHAEVAPRPEVAPVRPEAAPTHAEVAQTRAPVAKTRVAESSHAPAAEPARATARRDGTTVARADGAARANRKAARVAPSSAHARAPTGAARFASAYGAGALRPTAASIAAVHAPSAAETSSPQKSALPPRIVAMLAATQPSSDRARAAPPNAGAPAASNAVPAASPSGAAPTPFPANGPAPPAPNAIQHASFQPVDYELRAHDVLATHVPRVAQRAERLAARALFLADHVEESGQLADVLRAADAVRLAPQDPLASLPVWSAEARSLGDASRAAIARRAAWNEAVDYQTRAFGANPLDAAVVGHLAALQLQRRPVDVLAARSLALHALAVHDAAHPGGRIEDWATLAVANALAGRERDARAAWLVTLALAPGAERACRVAMDAYATWGERVRESVETLVYRAHQWNRDQGSRECEWPPRRMAGLTPLS